MRSVDMTVMYLGTPNRMLTRELMLESHERILRRMIRRFGSFPTRTYSNRISNDANVRITHEERSGRVLNLNKTCA